MFGVEFFLSKFIDKWLVIRYIFENNDEEVLEIGYSDMTLISFRGYVQGRMKKITKNKKQNSIIIHISHMNFFSSEIFEKTYLELLYHKT